MAKAKKAAAGKKKPLSRTSLVATRAATSKPANVTAVFRSGLGQITALLFRKGVLINMQSISNSGSIHFSDVISNDAISVNGICSGTAEITVSVPTQPGSPQHFKAQNINCGFDII